MLLVLLISLASTTAAAADAGAAGIDESGDECIVPFQVDSRTHCFLNSTSLHQVTRGQVQLQTLVHEARQNSGIGHLSDSHEALLEAGEREIIHLLVAESTSQITHQLYKEHGYHHHPHDIIITSSSNTTTTTTTTRSGANGKRSKSTRKKWPLVRVGDH